MSQHLIMDKNGIRRTLVRLSNEIVERIGGIENTVLLGIKRGGEIVAKRIASRLTELEGVEVPCGGLDITLERDDLVSEFFVPDYSGNEIGFELTGKTVVLCDDVLYTGRSVRAAIETIFSLGRPERIYLLEMIDRGGRQLPIRADFVGKNVPTAKTEYIDIRFEELGASEDAVYIVKEA
jgi:pyrimidine operon attenuation protein/uracil phosphoribosyltransferase